MNHLRLGIKLKTTDWPAAVARDFLLAAANTVPLFLPEGSAIPLENRIVDEDIRVLAQLANQIQTNDGNKKMKLYYHSLSTLYKCHVTSYRFIQTDSKHTDRISTIPDDATPATAEQFSH